MLFRSPPRGPVDNTTPPRRPDVCRNFQRGNCRFGARCRYLHTTASQQRGGVPFNTQGKGSQAPWPSMQNPWAGSIQMWPGPPPRAPLLGIPQAHPAMLSPSPPWSHGAPSPLPWPPGTSMPPLTWPPGVPGPSTMAPPPATPYTATPPAFDQGALMQAFNTTTLTPQIGRAHV